ncbi:MAG: hypothetical protein P8J32_06590 [bacterium]|nr:hypothetical protein [bacterium]
MDFQIDVIIFWLLLADSIIANLMTWIGAEAWWPKQLRGLSRILPAKKAWTSIYLLLILWVGSILLRLDMLPWVS